jgi:hypothetical protein
MAVVSNPALDRKYFQPGKHAAAAAAEAGSRQAAAKTH